MPTIAQLNVRLGLLSKDFDRQLKDVERSLNNTAQRLTSLGSDLSASLSLPLIGIGAAAIKSAGDVEALRLAMVSTMEDAGRSAEDAAAEVEALRIAALAPGLDFEQAIRGSIRLQNVGFAAEEARAILEQLGNAVALTGGTAHELDSVTRQFTQMIAKGRILQEDLTIIQENMPAISKAMDQAFGTRSADQLRELGITGEEFVRGIVAQLGELPRVSGGIKNAIVNFFTGMKVEAARLGEEINKVFNVGDISNGIVSAVHAVVDAFASLGDGSKKVVIGMAAVLAAMGPLAFAGGKLVSVFSLIKTGFISASSAVALFNTRLEIAKKVQQTIQTGAAAFASASANAATATQGLSVAFAANAKAADASKKAGQALGATMTKVGAVSAAASGPLGGLTAAIQRASAAFAALNAAQKLLLVGGIIAVVGAIAIAFNELTRSVTDAEAAQMAVKEASIAAEDAITEERVKAEQLVGVLKDETSTRKEKEAALKELQKISPKYFGQLDLEKSKVGQIDAALKGYVEALRRAAKAQAAFAQIVDLEKQLNNIKEAAAPSFWDKAKASLIAYGSATTYAANITAAQAANEQELRQQIEAKIKALEGVIEQNGPITQTSDAAAASTRNFGAAAAETSERAKAYAKALASIAAVSGKGDVLGANVLSEQAKEIERQIENLLEVGFKPASREVGHLRSMLVGLRKDAEEGFSFQNATQSALGALERLDRAISEVVGNAKNLVELSPGVDLAPVGIPSIDIPTSIDLGPVQRGLDELTALNAAAQASISDIWKKNSEETARRIEEEGELRFRVLEAWANSVSSILDTVGGFAKLAGDKEIKDLEDKYAVMLDAAKGNADAEAAIREELARKREEIERRVGRQQKAVAILNSIINTALGVTKALASAPPPFNFALAAAVGAAGAAQTALIAAQPLARGGVLDEPTLALIGEYPGAKSNPEIVTPENKMREVFEGVLSRFQPVTNFNLPASDPTVLNPNYTVPASMLEANVALNLDGQFVLRGDDLLLLVDKAAARRGRRS